MRRSNESEFDFVFYVCFDPMSEHLSSSDCISILIGFDSVFDCIEDIETKIKVVCKRRFGEQHLRIEKFAVTAFNFISQLSHRIIATQKYEIKLFLIRSCRVYTPRNRIKTCSIAPILNTNYSFVRLAIVLIMKSNRFRSDENNGQTKRANYD